ncbi:hypothetical protein [Corynebacterium urogenitale]
MRKFRNSALAIATATTVALGGMSVASAEDTVTIVEPSSSAANLSSETGDSLNKDIKVNGEQLFGSGNHETQPNGSLPNFTDADGNVATWAKVMYGVGIAAAIASFFGLIVAPLYNFFTFNTFG